MVQPHPSNFIQHTHSVFLVMWLHSRIHFISPWWCKRGIVWASCSHHLYHLIQLWIYRTSFSKLGIKPPVVIPTLICHPWLCTHFISGLPRLPRLQLLLPPNHISTINHHQIWSIRILLGERLGLSSLRDNYQDENTSSDKFPKHISISMTLNENNLICIPNFHARNPNFMDTLLQINTHPAKEGLDD